jgi:CheY-like chemotaxis protein
MELLNFLFIEDDELTNELMASMLRDLKFPHQYHFSSNGYEALHFLRNCEITREIFPDVIFVDLKMPIIDGFEFIGYFENEFYLQHPHTKIFVLTSSTRSSDVEKAFSYKSVVDYFPKPLSGEVIFSILDKYKSTVKTASK